MFAMVMRHLQLMGFPKTVYNQDLIGQWNNEVGQAIGVRGLQPGQSMGEVAVNLQPADMSAQIIYAIDKAMAYTKECLGATDVQMGAAKPDNTSALMVLQSNAEIPLENTRALLYQWVEDIGAILLDMMGAYYGTRPIVRTRRFREPVLGDDGAPVIDPITGQMRVREVSRRVSESFDFSQFRRLWFNVRCDVGATTYFSEIAMVQTLDNLRREGMLDVISYLERLPDKLVPKKNELIDSLRERLAAEAEAAPEEQKTDGAPSIGGELDPMRRIQNLPQNLQERFDRLPKTAQRALLNL